MTPLRRTTITSSILPVVMLRAMTPPPQPRNGADVIVRRSIKDRAVRLNVFPREADHKPCVRGSRHERISSDSLDAFAPKTMVICFDPCHPSSHFQVATNMIRRLSILSQRDHIRGFMHPSSRYPWTIGRRS